VALNGYLEEGEKRPSSVFSPRTYELSSAQVTWWVDPGLTQGVHQSCSITSPPQLDRGEKIGQKAHGSR